MKKTALILTLSLAAMVSSGLAQYTSNAAFSWNPAGPTSVSAGSSFGETLNLQITGSPPTQFSGFDLILESGNAPSSDFAVTAATSPLQGQGWNFIGTSGFPDTLTTANSDHSGFVQNQQDLGFAGPPAQADSNYSSATAIATYTLSIAPGTPAGTYTFESTGFYASTAGGNTTRFSDVSDGTNTLKVAPATFTITVVPEPATWSLFGLGALGAFGLNLLRARRKA